MPRSVRYVPVRPAGMVRITDLAMISHITVPGT